MSLVLECSFCLRFGYMTFFKRDKDNVFIQKEVECSVPECNFKKQANITFGFKKSCLKEQTTILN